MVALDATGGIKRCLNGLKYNACNWVVANGSSGEMCPSCELNRTIPDLSIAENVENWQLLESAKRRALHTLPRFDLFPPSKMQSQDGLAFDFLMPVAKSPVLTGHKDGEITVNLREADDSYRERQRHNLGEPYRTLVGHFRHEMGHYFWDRFFRGRADADALLQELRKIFGDERADYAAALKQHYAKGAPRDWNLAHVSAYATSHPWEDWAETWAQYLHMQDGLETVRSFGWNNVPAIPFTPFTEQELFQPDGPSDAAFLRDLNDWLKLSPIVNEMAAGLGHPNLYPFVFSSGNARKLYFVHRVVNTIGRSANGQGINPPPPSLAAPSQPMTAVKSI